MTMTGVTGLTVTVTAVNVMMKAFNKMYLVVSMVFGLIISFLLL